MSSDSLPSHIVVLLPEEARLAVVLEQIAQEMVAQRTIETGTSMAERGWRRGQRGVMVQRRQREVVDVDPNRPSPVRGIARSISALIEPICGGQGAQAKRRPQERFLRRFVRTIDAHLGRRRR